MILLIVHTIGWLDGASPTYARLGRLDELSSMFVEINYPALLLIE